MSHAESPSSSYSPLIPAARPDDDSNVVTVDSDQGPVLTKTTWTLLLYLTSATEGCQGGETVFHPHDRRVAREEVAVPPETGMLLLHKHGNDCMLVSWFGFGHGSGTLPLDGPMTDVGAVCV